MALFNAVVKRNELYTLLSSLADVLSPWLQGSAKKQGTSGTPQHPLHPKYNSLAYVFITASQVSTIQQLRKSTDLMGDAIFECVKRTHQSKKDSYTSPTNQLLPLLSPILCASLASKHRHIKNSALEFWNDTFGKAKKLSYSPSLLAVLQKLRETAPVILPEAIHNKDEDEVKEEEEEEEEGRSGKTNKKKKQVEVLPEVNKVEDGGSSSYLMDDYLTASMGVPTQMFPGNSYFFMKLSCPYGY